MLTIYLAWLFLNALFPAIVHEIHFSLIKAQAWASAKIITLVGYQAHYIDGYANCLGKIFIDGNPSVCVGTGCSGLEMYIVYASFILLMNEGQWIKMTWFLPLGLFIIIILNIIRIVSLAFIHKFVPEYLAFNHKYTFVLILYGAVFGLWYLWLTRVAATTKSKIES